MSTSVTVSLIKSLIQTLRSGKSSSAAVAVFRKVLGMLSALGRVFASSLFCRVLCAVADGIANCYASSVLHKMLSTREVERNSGSSVFYRIYSALIKGAVGIAVSVVGFLSDCARSSLVFGRRGAASHEENKTGAQNGIYIGFFGFIIAVMFCVPHSLWNNLFGLGIALVLFAWVIYGVCTHKDNVCIRPDKTYLSLLLFFASLILSIVMSKNTADSIRIFMFFITSVLLCVSISMFASKKNAFESVCVMLFACVVVTGVVGIVQAILKVEADASLTDLTLNANMPGRVFSTMGNPNNFAQMLVLFLPFCAAYALNVKSKAKKAVLLALLVVPFVALLQTYSRSGWIAFAVTVAVFVALSNRRAVPFLILICVLAIPFLPESILNRILTIGNLEDSSSSYRLVIWEGAFEMLSDWWVSGVGIGPGAFKAVYPGYAYGTTADVAHCHMQFLEVFLETGIIGFVSFIWMTLTMIKRSFLATSCKDKSIKYYGAAAAASMTGIIFIGFFEYYWFYPRVMFSFFICAGLAIAVYRMWQDEKAKNV